MPGDARILLDHVTLTVTDLGATATFFDAALAPLGIARTAEFLDPEDQDEVGVEAVSWAGADGAALLWVVAGREPTTGVHLAFAAPDESTVRRCFDAALAAGGTSRRAPRGWEIYRPGGFGAMIESPDGALVEITVRTQDADPAATPSTEEVTPVTLAT